MFKYVFHSWHEMQVKLWHEVHQFGPDTAAVETPLVFLFKIMLFFFLLHLLFYCDLEGKTEKFNFHAQISTELKSLC